MIAPFGCIVTAGSRLSSTSRLLSAVTRHRGVSVGRDPVDVVAAAAALLDQPCAAQGGDGLANPDAELAPWRHNVRVARTVRGVPQLGPFEPERSKDAPLRPRERLAACRTRLAGTADRAGGHGVPANCWARSI